MQSALLPEQTNVPSHPISSAGECHENVYVFLKPYKYWAYISFFCTIVSIFCCFLLVYKTDLKFKKHVEPDTVHIYIEISSNELLCIIKVLTVLSFVYDFCFSFIDNSVQA